MRILVLGGYGLIGREVMLALAQAGFETVGLGRNAKLGARLVPRAAWIGADISKLTAPEDWLPHLAGVNAIVNAAGALQDGPRDRLAAVHDEAIRACVAAAEKARVAKWVQISATGAAENASTAFFRTKARGDAAVRASVLDWIILKPGLVISANAYGGTALIRALAGFPLVLPLVFADAKIQTVAATDVADAVLAALEGQIPMRSDFDLVEEEAQSLEEIARAFREWLGAGKDDPVLRLPRWFGAIAGRLGDAAGLLGWRSPLRTTSLKVLARGVRGDPHGWRAASGAAVTPLAGGLAAFPSSTQDRVFARVQIVLPLAIVILAAFWLASGVIGLFQLEGAGAHLSGVAGDSISRLLVLGGSLVDIAIGAAFLFQRTARFAALASIAVSVLYLAAGTLVAPELWLDPLGVMVKVIPAMMLSLMVSLLMVER